MTRPRRLAHRMMTAQVMVIGVGAITLVVAALLVAPALFHQHLTHTGVASPEVLQHAEEAFASSFAISLALSGIASLAAAGVVSWLLVRRVSQPVEDLAQAAESVAAGHYDVAVPDATFADELHGLSQSFSRMATRLAATDASRTRLLADLAHELRTPLATLEAYIDGMEDDVLPVDARSWDTMRDQVTRLRRLAGDLREAAAAEEHALGLVMTPIDTQTVVDAAVAAAAPRYAAKGVALASEPTHRPAPILGDAVRLQQVLANLLDNALRHTPSGGHVTVGVTRTGDHVTIGVTDDGEGIPTDHLDSVFDRFHRVDPSRNAHDGSGSGLGLTIARAIVNDHGGTIHATSAGPGTGTTFQVTLPIGPAGRHRQTDHTGARATA